MNDPLITHHLHPLRQTHNLDYSATTTRKSSSSSIQSSVFSNSASGFDRFHTSIHSPNSSLGSSYRDSVSETRDLSAMLNENWNSSYDSLPIRTYNSMKHSAYSPLQNKTPSISNDMKINYSPAQSEGLSERPKKNSRTNSNLYKSESSILSRANSICQRSSLLHSNSIHHLQSSIRAPDLHSLQKSSTSQLRTLSKFAKDITSDYFNIFSPTQKVAGLYGRRKLQKSNTAKVNRSLPSNRRLYEWKTRNWMDSERQFLQAYEYFCHISEAKEWIEKVLQRPIPPIVQLEEVLRDGVTLAEIVVALRPDKKIRIFRHPKLQYRHSDNIATFFRFLADVELPDLFRFELTDLYEKKNTPKVIYCIHALSWLLYRNNTVDFPIGNLLGQLEFEYHELEEMQKGLEKAGVSMPSFENMGVDFGLNSVPNSEFEQIKSEEDLIRSKLEKNLPIIIDLQAQAREAMNRLQLGEIMHQLWDSEETLIYLQSIIRGDFARQVINYRISMRRFSTSLQSIVRGFLTRHRWAGQNFFWKEDEEKLITLQNLIRSKTVRSKLDRVQLQLVKSKDNTSQFQAQIRGFLIQRSLTAQLNEAKIYFCSISYLQAAIRGMSSRRICAKNYQILSDETISIKTIQASARAVTVRRNLSDLKAQLREISPVYISIQSILRGNQSRQQFQLSAAQASLIRLKFEEKLRYFMENMEKVVKIQSFVRSRLQGEAYKILTTGKNPPVNTVKNFVHLNDSDFDFNEEIEFERLRKTVVQQVRQNEMAEQYIDQLDIKIALLVKNKITLDEVVRHQKNFGGHPSNLLNTTMVSGSQFDLKALNKSSRKKLESYQQLFFTLQTQPHYLARLFKHIRQQGTAEIDCNRIETLMMVLFGYAQKRREEYYLLKLMTRSAKEEVDSAVSIKESLRGNFIWTRILANYTRSPRDRRFLRELLGPFIQASIIGDPTLDLESDPMQIYCSVISNEELRTGQASHRPIDITREQAIKDTETRELFINHLRDLREIVDDFLLSLESLVNKMPYGIRFVCQQIFQAIFQRFSCESQQLLLQTVGNWLWKIYLQLAFLAPVITGIIERQMTPLLKRILSEIAKVLNQISSGRLFGGENIYLQPLNAYMENAIERVTAIFANIISVSDAESTFDIDEFNDLYAKVKPTLYIKMDDIFAIHKLIEADLPHICQNKDDLLRDIIHELGSAKNNENEMLGVSSIEIQMKLNPKLHDIEDPEADIKELFMETKRCVLYIIRVQTGSNLMEILIRPITPEDEIKWNSVIIEEFSVENRARGAYSDINSLVDIKSMSYKDLKRTALENVLKLEQLGRISRQNFYQDILNAIALDIRNKSRRSVQRHRELEGVRLTLANSNEEAEWLESQRKSYDNYIEQAMISLQKKGKNLFMPFSKQYNHERELERSGRKPKFGSFKYSTHTLFDKGVLVSWKGYTDRDWDKTNILISRDEVEFFSLKAAKEVFKFLESVLKYLWNRY
ncbi:Ras GTPase-activating-like protein rng2 [Erysiphe necator]|nr:Ras GTPase-activating-like protein rng2 [Erysiphe necator]